MSSNRHSRKRVKIFKLFQINGASVREFVSIDVRENSMTDEDKQKKDAVRKAKNAEKMRIWRAKNPPSPEKKAKEAERARKWREANREKSRAHYRAWTLRKREQN